VTVVPNYKTQNYCVYIYTTKLETCLSVSQMNDYSLYDRGLIPSTTGIFFFTTTNRLTPGPTKSPIQWVTREMSARLKGSRCQADYPPTSHAEAKNKWSVTSISSYVCTAWCFL